MSMKRHTTEQNMTTVEDGHNTADDGEKHNKNRREIQTQQHSKLINHPEVDTKNNTADLFTNTLTDCVQEHLRRNWDLHFLDMAGGTNVGIAEGGPNRKDQ